MINLEELLRAEVVGGRSLVTLEDEEEFGWDGKFKVAKKGGKMLVTGKTCSLPP